MYKLILIQWLYKRGFIIPFYDGVMIKPLVSSVRIIEFQNHGLCVQNHILE